MGGSRAAPTLINHTSGLADGFTSPTVQGKIPTGCTVEELLTAEAKFPPVAPPGAKWSYSNYGYNLLGRVVELAGGQDLSTAGPAAHRPAARPAPRLAPDLGQRPQRALHPRVRAG
ncbi:serine hydrolase [Streptomyces sp. 4.24]|uniref:serine hydrolase n=1 Tax=Streptomyces tritrimontium TaxID=3406573 RepID=UPI003BB75031